MVHGDWYWAVVPAHTGEVYLNGNSLYEVEKSGAGTESSQEYDFMEALMRQFIPGIHNKVRMAVKQFFGQTFQEFDPNQEMLRSVSEELFLSVKGRNRLYHFIRIYHLGR